MLNCESLTNNYEELERIVEISKPAVIICSETCLTTEIKSTEIELRDYKLFRTDSVSRHTGGVAIYVRSQFKSKSICKIVNERNFWCCGVKISSQLCKGLIFGIYHSPSSSDANCMQYIEEFLESHYDPSVHTIVAGDFNIDLNKISTYSNKMRQIFDNFGLKQVVNEDTRITAQSKTKLDLIFTNIIECQATIIKEWKISDHETIKFEVYHDEVRMRETKTIISWEKYDKYTLMQEMSRLEWANMSNDGVDETVKRLEANIMETMSKIVYEKSVSTKLMNKWYDRELCELNKLKYQHYISANDEEGWQKYNEIKIKYKKMIKAKKIKYMETKVKEKSNDAKSMWKELKNMVKMKQSKEEIEYIIHDNVRISEVAQMAEKFNNYFLDSVLDLNESIDIISVPIKILQRSSVFDFKEMSIVEIQQIVESLEYKIGGKKLLSYGVVKDAFDYIGFFLKNIVNESFGSGIFPESWKTSTIIPMHKVNKAEKIEDF